MNPTKIASLLFGIVTLCTAWQTVSAESRQPDRPNILFAIADDASFPHMGAYGTEWTKTPAFDRVAREGLLFNRCYTPNAKCAPSRSCILTGRNSWQLEAAANHWCTFPPKFKSFVEAFADHKYHTGMTGKGWGPGVALTDDGKPRQMTGKKYGKRRQKPPAGGISSTDYAANFVDFLDDVDSTKPFFFWYGGFEPHRAYEYASGTTKAGKSIDDIKHVPDFWPDNDVTRTDMLDYAMEIEHFDTHLGRMIDELQRRGELENTLIVVTSDNGMPFPRVKGNEYEMSNHLPLAIMWPTGIVSPGRQINDLVSFIDFGPTFFDVASIDWSTSGMSPTSGRSMLGLLKNKADKPHRDFVLIGKERHDIGRPMDAGYPIRGIIKDSFLLIKNYEPSRWPSGNPETGYLNTDGSPTKTEILAALREGRDHDRHWQEDFGKRPPIEMYNVETDPDCVKNLASVERYDREREEMMVTMTDALRDENDPRVLGNGDVFEQYESADEKNKGFYEAYMKDPASVKAGWVKGSDFQE
ncbi:Arylsulfatase precursor [Rubripirellula tenax]|uniref:Arylsulfatase n=1 Tax=Rubripirellula tenax TaxID=2528015 RepID=A0A5C6E6F2_9BACT|nr:sulfatase [Rubripirellula tenax]TWU44522.1 Arylsulfatase precursor [Rubripirellula tenax]